MHKDSLNLFEGGKLEVTLMRMCHQLRENHGNFENSVILGIQPRGIFLAQRVHSMLENLPGVADIPYGELDVTFFRDDFRRQSSPLRANTTRVDFLIENKNVVLVDDVLYTGRTLRAAMDAMLAFGRPESVELFVLVDRFRMRDLPVQPTYLGVRVDTPASEKVIVRLKEGGSKDSVTIESKNVED